MSTWKKVERGFYIMPGTRYGVVADGYTPGKSHQAEVGTGYEGFIAGEWAVVRFAEVVSVDKAPDHNDGETMLWEITMREARRMAEIYHRHDIGKEG
jgi:hypothetical protein